MADARKTPETGSAVCGRGQSVEQPCRYDEAERLRDELIDYIDSTGEEDIDIQKLDELLSRIEELDPRPENDLYGPQKACEAEAEKQNSAGPDFHSSKRKGPKVTFKKLWTLVAAVIAVIGLLSFNAAGDKQESKGRSDGKSFWMENGGESNYAIICQRPLEEGEMRTYDSVQDMLDDFGIDAQIIPTEVPERLGKAIDVKARNSEQGVYLQIIYETETEFLNFYYSELTPSNTKSTEVNREDTDVERIREVPHYIVVDKSITKIVWINGELECHLSGNLPYEEMVEVLYSIYED